MNGNSMNKIEAPVILKEINKWEAFVIFKLVWLSAMHGKCLPAVHIHRPPMSLHNQLSG